MTQALTEARPTGGPFEEFPLLEPRDLDTDQHIFIMRVAEDALHVLSSGVTGATNASPQACRVLEFTDLNTTSTMLALDIQDAVLEATYSPEERRVIQELRELGRPVLANRLDTMLENMAADDEPKVSIMSLRDMARLFIAQDGFADPSISPARGVVHAQWRIDGNGALVWGFIGNDRILVIAQADATPDRDSLDISTSGNSREIVGEFGHLVPSLE